MDHEALRGLDERERVALAALLKAMVTADATVSREEAGVLGEVSRAIGGDAFRRAEAITFDSEARLTAFLATVSRRGARDVIHDTLAEAAEADGVDTAEQRILDSVRQAWDIVVV